MPGLWSFTPVPSGDMRGALDQLDLSIGTLNIVRD